MKNKLLLLPFLLAFVLFISLQSSGQQAAAQAVKDQSGGADVQAFQLLSANEGWLLGTKQLYWTANGGKAWKNITPTNLGKSSILSAFFVNAKQGWLVLTGAKAGSDYALARTSDGGKTWKIKALALAAADQIDLRSSTAYLDFVDAKTGWLVFKRPSGSNFSSGALFATKDGGETWTALNIPVGEPVSFLNAQQGWVAGGPAQDQLYRTVDGGKTWSAQAVNAAGRQALQAPRFQNGNDGVLPVMVTGDNGSELQLFATHDGGASWQLSPTKVGSGVVQLDMATDQVGWAKRVSGNCRVSAGAGKSAVKSCTSKTELVKTADGGKTWQALALPAGLRNAGLSPADATQIATQGFDKCEVPTLAQLSSWWNSSPYRAVNLYIGGVNRACPNSALSNSFVQQASQQGWVFMPVWVGPQGGGSGKTVIVSSDPTTAFNQGVNEANAAADTATALGLPGTVVYYSVAPFTTSNATYLNAVKSLLSGWSSQLRTRGFKAGVFGASCAAGLGTYASIANAPDVVWPAGGGFFAASYSPFAGVFGNICVPDSVWNNHQRIYQYTPSHAESWGGTALAIDSDVIDGLVATFGGLPPGTPTPTITATATPTTIPIGPTPTPNPQVVLGISPATSSVGVNQIFTLTVQVRAGSQPVDTAIANLTFDPGVLTVLTNPEMGSSLGLVLAHTFDPDLGTIDCEASIGPGQAAPSGTFTLCTITFQAIAPALKTRVEFASTSDVAFGGTSVLSSLADATVDVLDVNLEGTATFQRRLPIGDPSWETLLRVSFTKPGDFFPTFVPEDPTTDAHGRFELFSLPTGTFEIRAKPEHALQNLRMVTLNAGANFVDMGKFLEGDADDDNVISLSDAEIVDAALGACSDTVPPSIAPRLKAPAQSDAVYDPSADFNVDGCVDALDLSLLISNFMKQGAPPWPVPVPAGALTAPKVVTGSGQLVMSPASISATAGQVFTVQIQAQTGSQPVNGAQASLDFDPTVVKVLSITAGNTLSQTIVNKFDNKAGTADFAAIGGSDLPTDNFTVAEVKFQALAASTGAPLRFHIDKPRASDIGYKGDSILGSTSDAIVAVQPGACTARPRTPVLVSPRSGSTSMTQQVALDWKDAAATALCPVNYELQLKQSSSLGKLLAAPLGLTSSDLTTGVLTKGKTYYWHVRACNLKGCSAWTGYRYFRVSAQAQ